MEPPGVNPLQLLERTGQAQWLQAQARRARLVEHARYLAALQALLNDPHFVLTLEYWMQTLFLTGDPLEPSTPEQRGEERFFWRLMRELRQAGELPRQLAAREGLHDGA